MIACVHTRIFEIHVQKFIMLKPETLIFLLLGQAVKLFLVLYGIGTNQGIISARIVFRGRYPVTLSLGQMNSLLLRAEIGDDGSEDVHFYDS